MVSVATIERRLSCLVWSFRQLGVSLDRDDRHIASVVAGLQRPHARHPRQKAAVPDKNILAMVASLPHDLRDSALLLLDYARGVHRSEIVSLEVGKENRPASYG